MNTIFSYSFGQDSIDKISDFLVSEAAKGYDLSKTACVFGGKRPALFLRRAISKKLKKSFLPPKIFSIVEFIEHINSKKKSFQKLSSLDSSFLIYTLSKKYFPDLIKGKDSFAEFISWAEEIASFIEQLDLENIKNSSLEEIQKSAQIGYEVPSGVNKLLQNIVFLREKYHKHLLKANIYSRGLLHLNASACVDEDSLADFEKIIFCNLFYLHSTEKELIREIFSQKKGICFFEGSADEWSVLKENEKFLQTPIKAKTHCPSFNLSLYQGFDIHSQVCLVREILKKLDTKDETVIVLPRPDTLIPLLGEIEPLLDEFNVSLGHPLKRNPLYALLSSLRKAQESRNNNRYYTKDYLAILREPLIKNLKLSESTSITRVLIHKLEEILKGMEETSIGGSLFLTLGEIENEFLIYENTIKTLRNMDIYLEIEECKTILKRLHDVFFRNWEAISDFSSFSSVLESLLDELISKSKLLNSSYNIKVVEVLENIKDEFQQVIFSKDKFKPTEIWDIFQKKLESEKVSFIGSPLRGVQILGLFETRSLSFKNVIILDVNEGLLPQLKVYQPLIPREVMLNLGLNRLEKEEEMQRYHFMRLVNSAENVHLVYVESPEKEKSRFIEELLWLKQRECKKIDVFTIPKASFSLEVLAEKVEVAKTAQIIDFIKGAVFSASRLNTYLRCPLEFYYQYILGLREDQDLLDDPQSSCIGIFIHKLLEETFHTFLGKKPLIDSKFKKYFLKKLEDNFRRELAPRMRSDSLFLKKIIENRLSRFLDIEAQRDIAEVIALEQDRKGTLKINNELFKFTYTIDRIDKLSDESLVVIDYKTGSADIMPKKLSILKDMNMDRDSINNKIKSFQLPLYYHFIAKDFPNCSVNAQVYNLRTLERKPFISEEDYPKKEEFMNICFDSLEQIFSELLDPDVPFRPSYGNSYCQYCAFSGLCK